MTLITYSSDAAFLEDVDYWLDEASSITLDARLTILRYEMSQEQEAEIAALMQLIIDEAEELLHWRALYDFTNRGMTLVQR